MMLTHIYNPEHDLAMAYGGEGFTPPAAGRGMRAGLGFLPAFWANEGDSILVDDVTAMERAAAPFGEFLPKVAFVSWSQLPDVVKSHEHLEIRPWGWDMALRHQLLRTGVPAGSLPTTGEVERVRMLSHRRTTIPLLRHLVDTLPDMVGKRLEANSLDEVRQWLLQEGAIVCKAPWSCSGRGVRFVEKELDDNLEGFLRNVLAHQGCVIVEHGYHRLMDFAMEFMAEDGVVRYEGLSLFDTRNGAYSGNVLAVTAKSSEDRLVHVDETLTVKWKGGYDSMVTSAPGVMLCVSTADCLPVFLYDAVNHAVGIAHSGWRGTCSGIAVSMIDAMKRLYGTRPDDLKAVLGPSNCGNCYEVKDDVLIHFRKRYDDGEMEQIVRPKGEDKYLLDNKAAVCLDLIKAGIDPKMIHDTGICSFESPDYASYRRDGRVEYHQQTLSGIVLI